MRDVPAKVSKALLSILVVGALSIQVMGCDGATEPGIGASHTNVLWLILCTLRADRLGAYGHPGNNTPNLDRLAEEGTVFRGALSQAPWTRPSIGSMLTGVYPRTLGIEDRERWPNDRGLDPRFETIAEKLHAAGYATFGITANPNTNAIFQFDRGYDQYQDTGKLWRDGYADKKLSAEDLSRGLLTWLDAREGNNPFFAQLVMIDAHKPYRGDVAKLRLKRRSDASLPKHPYDVQVRYLDDVIGELLGELSRRNLSDTLVVVTADHGEGLRDRHPQDLGHGPTLFDTRLAVPLIFHHPALPVPGRALTEPVELVDIVPTLLDLLGVAPGGTAVDGRSLASSIVAGTRPEVRDAYVAETAYGGSDQSAIRAGGWKLIVDHKLEPAEPLASVLYAIESDPSELDDVSDENPERTSMLREQLRAWQVEREKRRPSTPSRGDISESELNALRTLGYIEGEPSNSQSSSAD